MQSSGPQLPTGLNKYMMRLPLYMRIFFGLIVLFGMVGNCAGKSEGAFIVFAYTAIMWVCMRIIQEAIQSLTLLGELNSWEEEMKKLKPKSPTKTDDVDE